ncbi:hypothetical protein cypCar_00008659 [Cyprinus carpio]|nr:hypothetical protein cypCar_00008659 [Cyprinus carpio]
MRAKWNQTFNLLTGATDESSGSECWRIPLWDQPESRGDERVPGRDSDRAGDGAAGRSASTGISSNTRRVLDAAAEPLAYSRDASCTGEKSHTQVTEITRHNGRDQSSTLSFRAVMSVQSLVPDRNQ